MHAALDEALPDGLDVVEVVEAPGGGLGRPAAGQPVAGSGSRLPVADAAAGGRGVPRAEGGARPADDQEGAARLRLPRRGALAAASRRRRRAAALDLVLRHLEPAVRPDDVLAGLAAWAGSSWSAYPLLTRLAQGPSTRTTGEIGDPLRP